MIEWLKDNDDLSNNEYAQIANMLILQQAEIIALRGQLNELQ